MGLFDDVVCRDPLPHHQDSRFQTTGLAGFALGERWITGALDDYEVALDGPPGRHGRARTGREEPA